MMTRETVRRQMSNAIEYMYERGEMNFPKNLNTNKKFRITRFKKDSISFQVIDNGRKKDCFIFVESSTAYNRLKDTDENFAMKYFVMKLCKDMFNYSNIQ